jgi:hypothetical protein
MNLLISTHAARSSRHAARATAFTLLEVIVACAIFFMAVFSILSLVAGGLAAARALQQREPDAGMIASVDIQTNIMVEEGRQGDFEELYPGLYPGYSWGSDSLEIGSNGLFQVDYVVFHAQGRKGVSETRMQVLMFMPGSPPGSASKAMGGLGGR